MEKYRHQEMEQRFADCYKRHGDRSVLVLMDFYRGQYHKFICSTLFFVIKHSPSLFSPLLIANVINGAIKGGEAGQQAILLNTGIWMVLLCIHLPANWLHNKYKNKVIRDTEAGLRAALVRKLQELSIPYHTEVQSGRLQSKIMRDVEAVEALSSQLFVNLLSIIMNLIITLTITAVKNRLILLFFILVAPVAAIAILVFRRKIHSENRAFRQGMEETSAKVMEMVEMVPVARAHALEDKEVARIRSQFSALINLLPILTKGLESVSSIGEVLTSDDIEHNEGKKEMQELRGEYTFNNVQFSYAKSDNSVLRGLSMHVKQGETIALVGESGSGKTTILNLIIGFITPSDGRLLIDDMDVNDIDLRSYRKCYYSRLI